MNQLFLVSCIRPVSSAPEMFCKEITSSARSGTWRPEEYRWLYRADMILWIRGMSLIEYWDVSGSNCTTRGKAVVDAGKSCACIHAIFGMDTADECVLFPPESRRSLWIPSA